MWIDAYFDRLLEDYQSGQLVKDCPQTCTCDTCDPTPRRAVTPAWRDAFVNPDWNFWTALKTLGVAEITEMQPDDPHTDATIDVEGFADARGVWVRPDTRTPFKTAAHELAHHLLGHVAATAQLQREIDAVEAAKPGLKTLLTWFDICDAKCNREIEAETVALLVVAALDYPDGRPTTLTRVRNYTLQYMAKSLCGVKFPEAERVKAAARQILEAGGWREDVEVAS
jgi:hypothetical protein